MTKSCLLRLPALRLSLFCICLLLLTFSNSAYGQGDSRGYRHGAMFEGGGLGRYSFNYMRCLFAKNRIQGYMRVGASVYKDQLAVPVGLVLNFLPGDHHPEVSLGVTPMSTGYQFWERDESDIEIDLTLGIGYRYAPLGKRWWGSIGAFPAIRLDPVSVNSSFTTAKIRAQAGVSIGYWLAR